MKNCELDIDLISDELYELLLKAFEEQCGDGYYENWVISAVKEKP